MSFFNLTLMGSERPFESSKLLETNNKTFNPSSSQEAQKKMEIRNVVEKQLAREISGNIQSREWSSPAISNQ